ncbi:uncharacterized protein LY89DRAFT_55021 [Mollisia scopiformis]|uniref:Uncharacterized protein n=1 Tax=Mollisia scopiformis TaxID=149040 RepID=A0A194XBI2_MOLSC|nr:uncharacterized protein LY89DRAFT_55021 [Mollisia scopiformis]KUJ17521.1 hypothetical protein LY89DRAFT_55021 [Mollisia scopiformis]
MLRSFLLSIYECLHTSSSVHSRSQPQGLSTLCLPESLDPMYAFMFSLVLNPELVAEQTSPFSVPVRVLVKQCKTSHLILKELFFSAISTLSNLPCLIFRIYVRQASDLPNLLFL